ncbi:MAG TPA: efflux RND transporter permease subunit, partial [Chromatiaceae bacterium]|nr:efflux RND transporter permease subunit [Chromatiaceae bacterium]
MGTFFIDRPVFAAVIAILMTLLGLLAIPFIPLTQYPDIGPPTVEVSATYPGATAEVVANSVAAPLEEELNGLEGVMYMSSSSSSTGGMTLTLTFAPGTDPDMAQVNVQNRVNQKIQALPEAVRSRVAVRKKSGNYLMIIGITAPEERYDALYLGTYANLYLLDPIKRIPGASNAAMLPAPDLAMRVWLKPEELARLEIAPEEVLVAIQAQNKAYGVGAIGRPPAPPGTEQAFAVSTQGMLSDPEAFENIIVRAAREGTGIVRLKDLARVELGVQDYEVVTRLNGQRAVAIAIYQQAGTNAIAVSRQVRELLASLQPSFPAGIEYKVV